MLKTPSQIKQCRKNEAKSVLFIIHSYECKPRRCRTWKLFCKIHSSWLCSVTLARLPFALSAAWLALAPSAPSAPFTSFEKKFHIQTYNHMPCILSSIAFCKFHSTCLSATLHWPLFNHHIFFNTGGRAGPGRSI